MFGSGHECVGASPYLYRLSLVFSPIFLGRFWHGWRRLLPYLGAYDQTRNFIGSFTRISSKNIFHHLRAHLNTSQCSLEVETETHKDSKSYFESFTQARSPSNSGRKSNYGWRTEEEVADAPGGYALPLLPPVRFMCDHFCFQ